MQTSLPDVISDIKCAIATKSFWDFCQTLAPDFYKDDRPHLRKLCDTLDDFAKGKLLKPDGTPYKKLMINIPPQHGKTRTLIMFCMWLLGRNRKERIISCSYNDDTATDFSKYTRDGIQEQKQTEEGFVYSDIFPDIKIKHGTSSYSKWALEGEHFNYLGAGIGGSLTGKGGSVLIVDDPIKNAEEALNDKHLDKVWLFYTSTFLSRVSVEDDEPLEIIVMTRWAKGDVCGRILGEYKKTAAPQKDDWYVVKMEAMTNGEMLCPALHSRKRYDDMKAIMDKYIHLANYHNKPIDQQGVLYQRDDGSGFKTYIQLPHDDSGRPVYDMVKNYTDTADEGDDYLCSIDYWQYQGSAYVVNVIYTKSAMETTEIATAKMLLNDSVNRCVVESNNGGRGFARQVKEKVKVLYYDEETTHEVLPVVTWFHQSKNKRARIISNSTAVMDKILLPLDWANRWPEFSDAVTTYKREGKNKHDDAPDALTGIIEKMKSGIGFLK